MSLKDAVSKNYTADVKAQHGAKGKPPHNYIVMTGAAKPRSIGAAFASLALDRGAMVEYLPGDVRHVNPSAIYPNATALVMCHGILDLEWFEDADMARAREVIDVNLFGTLNVSQAFVRATLDNSWRKSIVSVGSMAYKTVLNGSHSYCASKAGMAMAMKCLAWELAPKGFDVFSVHPSNTEDTPMTDDTVKGLMKYRGLSEADALAYWNDSCLREKQLTKAEIAEHIWYLITGNSGYLSGNNIELAGGQR